MFDIDRHNDDRGNPAPNHSDSLTDGSIKAHKTISSHYTTDADSSTSRLQMQNKQIVGSNGTSQIVNYGVQTDGNFALKFFDANGVGVARFGQYADGSIALKVAKSGQEVDTATGNNLIFNSAQDTLKVVLSDSVTKVISSIASNSTDTTTVPHNLGVVPAFLTYVTLPSNFPSNYTPSLSAVVALPTIAFAGTATAMWVAARADSTNLYLDVYNPTAGTFSGPYTFVFKYYILQETAT